MVANNYAVLNLQTENPDNSKYSKESQEKIFHWRGGNPSLLQDKKNGGLSLRQLV